MSFILNEYQDRKICPLGYRNEVLVDNWNEEHHDIQRLAQRKPLPSIYGHQFGTTYDTDFNDIKKGQVPEVLKTLKVRDPFAHPAHQPELDPPVLKTMYQSFQTTSRADFIPPKEMIPKGQKSSSNIGHC